MNQDILLPGPKLPLQPKWFVYLFPGFWLIRAMPYVVTLIEWIQGYVLEMLLSLTSWTADPGYRNISAGVALLCVVMDLLAPNRGWLVASNRSRRIISWFYEMEAE